MPIYEYAHLDAEPCELGEVFERVQSIKDPKLEHCPCCGAPVRRYISRVGVSTPRGNVELRDMGFTKLVKRDGGVYENVTCRDGESRYMRAGQPDTLPHLNKIIRD